jgi:uncharacterized membrane protein
MTSTKTLLAAAIGSIMLSSVVSAADMAAAPEMEKCAGVAKAGKNDCASASHSCAGQAKKAGGAEWIKLPKGTCERLVGGKVVAK